MGLDMNICFKHFYLTLLLYKTPKLIATKIIDLFLAIGEDAIHSVILKMLNY